MRHFRAVELAIGRSCCIFLNLWYTYYSFVLLFFSMKKIISLFVVSMMLLLPSVSQAANIVGLPKGVNNFISATDLNKLKKNGFKVYTGSKPPKVEGYFAVDNSEIVYDAANNGQKHILPYLFNFKKQKKDNSLRVTYDSDLGKDHAKDVSSYISGSGKCFTLFTNQTGKAERCVYKSPQLFSACVVKGGNLEKVQFSYFVKSKKGPDCDNYLAVGYQRIVRQDLVKAYDSKNPPVYGQEYVDRIEAETAAGSDKKAEDAFKDLFSSPEAKQIIDSMVATSSLGE